MLLKLNVKIALRLRPRDAGKIALGVIALLVPPTIAFAAAGGSVAASPHTEPCRSAAVADHPTLEAHFWSSGDTISVSHGRSVTIAGKLAGRDGAPVAGATLAVEEFLIGAGPTGGERVPVPRIGFARTEQDGTFVYRMPAGPNRETILTYGDGMSPAACALRYFAAARPTLSIAPRRTKNRGRQVRFWGRLPGPQAEGHVLVLQVRRGEGWITFRQVTTGHDGRFLASYRFQRTFRPTVFTFRALVPRQAAYPWLAGASRLISVSVYPG